MKKMMMVAALACAFTGCMTERSRIVVEGETAEVTTGFSEDDIRYIVSKVVQDIDRCSQRYSTPQQPTRVVNVKNVKIDTMARGGNATYLAETIAQCFKEELTNGGKFYVYNEMAAQNALAAGRAIPYTPQFLLTSTLREQIVRRDNGNAYKEYSLNIQLIDVASNMEFWQKRVPLRKAVDKSRMMY